jgi:hypothetical protein
MVSVYHKNDDEVESVNHKDDAESINLEDDEEESINYKDEDEVESVNQEDEDESTNHEDVEEANVDPVMNVVYDDHVGPICDSDKDWIIGLEVPVPAELTFGF